MCKIKEIVLKLITDSHGNLSSRLTYGWILGLSTIGIIFYGIYKGTIINEAFVNLIEICLFVTTALLGLSVIESFSLKDKEIKTRANIDDNNLGVEKDKNA